MNKKIQNIMHTRVGVPEEPRDVLDAPRLVAEGDRREGPDGAPWARGAIRAFDEPKD